MTISDQQRYLISETAISSGMNIIMSLAAAWVSSGGKFASPTTLSILPQTFMVGFMSVLVATLLTRMRRRRGRFASNRRSGLRFRRFVPGNAFFRALLAGVLCLVIATPIVSATLQMVLTAAPGPARVAVVTAVYALLLSLLLTPAALILALNEEPARWSPPSTGRA